VGFSAIKASDRERYGLGGGASGIRTLSDLSDSIAGISPEFGSLFGPEREDPESERSAWLRFGFSNLTDPFYAGCER